MKVIKSHCTECGRELPMPKGLRFTQLKVLAIVRQFDEGNWKLTGDLLAAEAGLRSRGDALNRLRLLRDRGFISGKAGNWCVTPVGREALKVVVAK